MSTWHTSYNHTLRASYLGYVSQAIVNIFVPLLFLTFQSEYSIPLGQITSLVTVNFVVQLLVDLISARFVDKTGYRIPVVAANLFITAGLAGLAVLPELLPSPYVGILLSVFLYAIGGGLMEVLISPIVEACPTERKEAAMSLLHSFYCWGCVLVIAVSTAFFALFGTGNWRVLAVLWALVPAGNAVYFSGVPINQLVEDGKGMSFRELFRMPLFWIFALFMVCAGAAEQSMSQWASAFAESGLHISKAAGDLAGPCFFAVLMGTARALYAEPRALAHRLRRVRLLRRHPVAGHVQPGGEGLPTRRHGDVRPFCAGGRPRLLRRAYAGGDGLRLLWGPPGDRPACSRHFPGAAAGCAAALPHAGGALYGEG